MVTSRIHSAMGTMGKIIKAVIFLFAISKSVGIFCQNIYDSRTIYYNMDTLLCVDKTVRPTDGDTLMTLSGKPVCNWRCCRLEETITLPVLEVLDSNMLPFIETCIAENSNDALQFPDSSGFFVLLHLSDRFVDSSKSCMGVHPFSNYDMGSILADDKVIHEFIGHRSRELHGCFYLGDILCVVTSFHEEDFKMASCLFSNIDSEITLMLYSPIVAMVSLKNVLHGGDYYYTTCD